MKIKIMLKRTKRWTVCLRFCAVLLLVALLAGTYDTRNASAQPPTPPGLEKIGPGVLEAIQQKGEAHIVIALNQTPAMAAARRNIPELKNEVARIQAQVLSSFGPSEYRGKHQYETVPGLAGTVRSENALMRLAANPHVRKVDLDVGGTGILGTSVPQIDADQRHNLGNTGEGVVVAFLDSGIDTDHPDLSDDLNQEACFGDNNGSVDGSGFCPNGSDRQTGPGAAEDDAGHGTHTAGIVTSGGVVSSQGVAPDANIVAIKVLNNCSFSGCFSAFSEIVAALDYIIANNATLGVDIINMSIGTSALFSGNCDNSTAFNMNGAASINTLRANGVIAFASAGNNGSGTQMTSPACLSNVVSVGAVDSSDTVAGLTNSNATTDIMAPGVGIISDAIGGGTTSASGTSMASPHAAGCAALLIEAGEATTPDQIETRLETSTIQVTDATNSLTFPRIDCGPANNSPVADAGGPYLGAVDTAIQFDGSGSSDPDGDTLTFDWVWGDSSSSVNAGATPTHNYSMAGIYDVCLTVTDPGGLSDTACTVAVVYDPSEGFITGGGWIDSPAGALVSNPIASGKAEFGFVSKYKKGASVPTGNTEFEFQAGGFNFYSDSYEWLVVNQGGSNAQFKGSGTVNGALDTNGNPYKFILWAGDGSPDTFRIKIWYEDGAGEHVVYDNGTNQSIGGGSIVIHKGK